MRREAMPPEADVLVQHDVEFNIFSKALVADDEAILKELGMAEPDGKKRLRTTASSNIKDLAGDEMTTKALEMMRASAEENMTIFLNHKYAVPDDVFGSVEKATLVDKGDYVDLDLIIRVNEHNPRALQTHASIVDGTKLGCSIGALIPEGGATKTKSGLSIDEVRLLEASIVGIPANPRSFVQYATKALMKAQLDDAPMDEIESSGPPKPLLRSEAASQTGLPASDVEKATSWVTTKPDGSVDVVVEGDPPAAAPVEEAATGKGKKKELEDVEPPEADPIQKEAAPPAEGDEGDPESGTEPADNAGETPAETTEATQEAPSTESTPETDGAALQAAVDEQLKAVKALGLDTLADLLKDVSNRLVVETDLRKAAEQRASDAEADLAVAKEIVSIIETIPLGRNTAFKAGVSEFRKRLSHVYSDEVMDLVER
jgi:HK97 family phage prohead protease